MPPFRRGISSELVKKSFENDMIAFLLELKWWDWDIKQTYDI